MSNSSNDSNQLLQVPQADWPALRELYRRDWPTNFLGFLTVDTFVRWTEQQPDIKHLSIYSLNGDWTDGTFVCVHRYQLFINSVNPSNDRLAAAVALLDWSTGLKCSSVLGKHRSAIKQTVSAKRLDVEFDSFTHLYYMPNEKAAQLEIQCPPGITLAPLREEHAEKVNKLWPNRHEGSLFFIKQIIELSPSVGAFDACGKLVAWCLRLQAGPLGALQVDDDHLKQGLGSLVCKALSKTLGEMGLDVCACVGDDNVASNRLFKKIGFTVIAPSFWLRTLPTTEPIAQWVD